MRFGYYVDSDGRPLAYGKKGSKNLPHFIPSPSLRRSLHHPTEGRFQKWDFVNERWVEDTEKVNEWAARKQGEKDEFDRAKQDFIALRDMDLEGINWTNPNAVKQVISFQNTRIVRLFRYVAGNLSG